jgi:alpha-2-macroglobulin
MTTYRKMRRWGKLIFLVICFVASLSACRFLHLPFASNAPAFVESLPVPELPDWIEQISPLGESQPLAQIRIRFKEPLIPLEAIASPQQQQLLEKFAVYPVLPGKFRFLTPKMVGFQADKAIPKATRLQVTLKAGLEDLKSHQLKEDLAWTFSTETIQLSELPRSQKEPDSPSEPIDINPKLEFKSNVELDLGSLRQNLKLIPQGQTKSIPLDINLKTEENNLNTDTPDAKFDPSSQPKIYTIKPKYSLKKATNYQLEISKDLRSINGNLPSAIAYSTEVFTYSPLAFEKTESYGAPDAGGAYGRFVQGSPQFKFNNGLVASSALDSIKIDPPPKKGVKVVRAYDGDNYISLNPWALEPNTNYEIAIDEKLKDQFGQTLEKPIKLNYQTGDISADIWAPTGLNIFPKDLNLRLNISTVNLPKSQYQAAYKVVEPTDLIFTDSAFPQNNNKDLLPGAKNWQTFTAKETKNKTIDNIIPLKEKLGKETGMIAYGIKAKTNQYTDDNKKAWRESEFYGLVQLTNLGVFAQWFPESGLVRVNHLNDGSVVANARIEIYPSQLEAKTKNPTQPCVVTQTDQTGTAKIEGQVWQNCLIKKTAPQLLVIVRENEDWAFTRTDEYSGAYEYGINANWDEKKTQSRGVIFSDRQLYQLGEKAWFTGTAYYLKNGVLTQDKKTPYQINLIDPNGKTKDLGTEISNDFGTFSFSIPLEKNQPLGYYSLRAKAETGVEIEGEFRVAEFKPPNFKVDLSLDKKFALLGEKITAKTNSQYLFGAPVQGGEVDYFVTRQKVDFIPKNWEEFSFGRQWFWPEEAPQVPNEVLQGSAVLDTTGNNSQTISVAEDLPYPMQYRVEAQVKDVSNLSVANTQNFTAFPDNRLIGLKSDFVANSGQEFPIKIIVTDPNGKVITGEKVRVELQKIDYSSVTQLQEGSATARHQIEYQKVAEQEINSSAEEQTINLTPPDGGSYRIQANFINAKNDLTATDLQVWVTGNNAVSWGDRYENNRLSIELDKKNYKVGETATALIQSPYPEAELYFAVVRHNTLYSTLQKVKGNAPKIQFQVTPEMLPNAAVEAVLVRQGKPLNETETGSVDKLVKIGFSPFNLNLEEQYLKVKITPQLTELQPKNTQNLTLNLSDLQGNPVQGQVSVMVVNDAVLQLTGYRPPDLVKTVYADRDISTRLADNRPQVILTPMASPLEKGWGYGGGTSTSIGNNQIRRDFQAIAFYDGSVLTDAQGQATVNFTLPDDLTSWRVMAVATDGNWHFGNGESTFVTTKPLVTNPLLPQFARLGDRFFGGVSVTNTKGEMGTLKISSSLNQNLKFSDKSSLETSANSGTQAYRFPIIAEQVGTGTVQFSSQLNQEMDSVEVPLTVEDLAITEQVITTGTTPNSVTIPLNINQNAIADVGGLEINLASTLIPEIVVPAKKVLNNENLPFLEPIASQLIIAANLEILSQKYPQIQAQFDLEKVIQQSLLDLAKLQQEDGGFASYPNAKKSDLFITPYAATSLAQVKTAGFEVNSVMLNNLKKYLAKIITNPAISGLCDTTLCKNQVRLQALTALSQLGETREDFLSSFYEQKDSFNLTHQIQLARYLSQFPNWQTEAQQLTQKIQQSIYETGRNAVINTNLPQGWRWFNSATTNQSQALQLFIAQKQPLEEIDRLLKGLLSLRRDGLWQNSYDNAQALMALGDYSQLEGKPGNFQASVELDRKLLLKSQFKGTEKVTDNLALSTPKLPKGNHQLTLKKSGQGMLHYLAAYRYRLPGNQAGQLNGLRVTRYVHPANETKILTEQGLVAENKPFSIPAGQVLDLELEIITDHPVNHLVINDPLPAGLEAIDTSFQTAPTYFQSQPDSWEINYQQIYRDRVTAYGDHLEAGVYTLHYLVRSVTPGLFDWPGAEVHLQYAPEEFGRSASSQLEITEK